MIDRVLNAPLRDFIVLDEDHRRNEFYQEYKKEKKETDQSMYY